MTSGVFRQHNVIPDSSLISDVTHVVLAFMRSSLFVEKDAPSEWPLFTNVGTVRSRFMPGTKIIVGIGGWGDTQAFSEAALTDESRRLFAHNIKRMIEETGADGMLSLQN